jgi:hypothetical protein
VQLSFFCSSTLTRTGWGSTLTRTGWVRSTINLLMHCPCCQLTQQHQEERKISKSWKRRDSNLGRLGGKRERYCCAMPTSKCAAIFIQAMVGSFPGASRKIS